MKFKPCPICRKAPAMPAFKPFCSPRCADADLMKWLKGDYHFESETQANDMQSDDLQINDAQQQDEAQ